MKCFLNLPFAAIARTQTFCLAAQDRVGGRVHSMQFGGITAELGAQFIWGSDSGIDAGGGNPLTEVRRLAE
jgi:hypothetical protein